eukprot:CAMPEP_0195029902 /NCGR_PEP_ID=MMETSP0326_2-20130528/57728_1 /TAXON_ID=2866 ORGANISM="Crypthecodinium cohnii, Strain Seligo" /NCGR_SAMPLE_ID=MMETSP0326_2 /ASSEMBLY_ACC=CAM_ASM_000348 /LENGTH=42 /DNA_ID= /DNA_START= /DNA_END= /DNA_ORIENTATION=
MQDALAGKTLSFEIRNQERAQAYEDRRAFCNRVADYVLHPSA